MSGGDKQVGKRLRCERPVSTTAATICPQLRADIASKGEARRLPPVAGDGSAVEHRSDSISSSLGRTARTTMREIWGWEPFSRGALSSDRIGRRTAMISDVLGPARSIPEAQLVAL